MAHCDHPHPLRSWRQTKGFTLQKVADDLGTSRQVVSDWERGRRRPGPRFMPLVRDLTGNAVSADDFYQPVDNAA